MVALLGGFKAVHHYGCTVWREAARDIDTLLGLSQYLCLTRGGIIDRERAAVSGFLSEQQLALHRIQDTQLPGTVQARLLGAAARIDDHPFRTGSA